VALAAIGYARGVSSDVAEKFEALFAAGHSPSRPSSPLETHKCDLQIADDSKLATRSIRGCGLVAKFG